MLLKKLEEIEATLEQHDSNIILAASNLVLAESLNRVTEAIKQISIKDSINNEAIKNVEIDSENLSNLPDIHEIIRINIKPELAQIDPKQHCLNNSIMAVGWGIKSMPTNFQNYLKKAAIEFPDGSYMKAITILHNTQNKSVVWTRTGNGDKTLFYIGLIIGPWVYMNDPVSISADCINTRKVIWHEVGGYSSIHKAIEKSFTPPTIAHIKDKSAIIFTKQLTQKLIKEGIWPSL